MLTSGPSDGQYFLLSKFHHSCLTHTFFFAKINKVISSVSYYSQRHLDDDEWLTADKMAVSTVYNSRLLQRSCTIDSLFTVNLVLQTIQYECFESRQPARDIKLSTFRAKTFVRD